MKVITLKHEVVNEKLVFKIEKPVEEKTFDQLDEGGKFSEDLRKLNLQRFMIRKSQETKCDNKIIK